MQRIAIILSKWGGPFFTLLIVAAATLSSEVFVAANAAKPSAGSSCTLVEGSGGNTMLNVGSLGPITDNNGKTKFSLNCRTKAVTGGTPKTDTGTACSSDAQTPSTSLTVKPFCQALDGKIQGQDCSSGGDPDTFTPINSKSFDFNASGAISKGNDPCTAIVWDFSKTQAPKSTCEFLFNAEGSPRLALNFEMANGNQQIPPYTASNGANTLTDSSDSKNELLKGVNKIFLDTTQLPANDVTVDQISATCGKNS